MRTLILRLLGTEIFDLTWGSLPVSVDTPDDVTSEVCLPFGFAADEYDDEE